MNALTHTMGELLVLTTEPIEMTFQFGRHRDCIGGAHKIDFFCGVNTGVLTFGQDGTMNGEDSAIDIDCFGYFPEIVPWSLSRGRYGQIIMGETAHRVRSSKVRLWED